MLIIKAGTSIPEANRRFGDFEHWFKEGLGQHRFEFTTLEVFGGDRLPADPADHGFNGVCITGSSAMVSHRNEWSEATARWLAEAHRTAIPMLGVCYGHQLLAHGLGGRVGPNPHGRRMGTWPLKLRARGDALFENMESELSFQTTHLEVVLEPPPGARILASAEGDPHHALHFGNSSWGVQFHPEFDSEIMGCYVRARAAMLEGEGQDYDRILSGIRSTPAGTELMGRFANLVAVWSIRMRASARYA